MKKIVIWILFIILGLILGVIFSRSINNIYYKLFPRTEESTSINILPKPLEKYSINNLSETKVTPVKINIDEEISTNSDFTSNLFSINFDPTLRDKNIKKVTGLINLPNKQGKFPLVLMLRGYVDQKIYTTGMGTQRVGEYFSENGFITIAPDFLGYAGSDIEANNIFESRFQTYTTALTILDSLSTIAQWDQENIFIWGHSNGGQVALTLLEITGKEIPTVLWAPVSKPFPYSILYYTDESDDLGKLIRRELSLFEDNYDVNEFSIHNYLNRIKAPIEIHQGALDDAVPIDWTNDLVQKLEDLEVDFKYHKYQGADHNLQPNWNLAVQRSLIFFQSFLE
ncbi:MAG: alpha/beta fold hydrolase [Patescibacteria group bacterium]